MKLIIDNLAISSKHQSKNNIMPRRSSRGSEATSSSSSSSSKKKVKSESPANADRNTNHSNKYQHQQQPMSTPAAQFINMYTIISNTWGKPMFNMYTQMQNIFT